MVVLHLAEQAAEWPAEWLEPEAQPGPVEMRAAGRLEAALHRVESVPVRQAALLEPALHPAGSVPVRQAAPLEPALHPAGSAPARLAARAQRELVDEGRPECCDSR